MADNAGAVGGESPWHIVDVISTSKRQSGFKTDVLVVHDPDRNTVLPVNWEGCCRGEVKATVIFREF